MKFMASEIIPEYNWVPWEPTNIMFRGYNPYFRDGHFHFSWFLVSKGSILSPTLPPKIKSSPLKNDAGKRIRLPFWDDGTFSGVMLNFRGCILGCPAGT